MKMDPFKTYNFTAEMRSLSPRPGIAELGFWLYDARGKKIDYRKMGGKVVTDTVLTAPSKKGDKVIRVQNARKWLKGGGSVAFGVQKGVLKEPFPHIVSAIRSIVHKEGYSLITLSRPVPKAYPAGTWVRQHQSAGHYTLWRGRLSSKWKTVTGKVAGISSSGAVNGKWWPTTESFKIRMAVNVGAGRECVTQIRNIRFEIRDASSYF